MPDDNRTQGPSNDAPRDPLDDLIYPILNRDVPAESTRATARPAASNFTQRDPLDYLPSDADLRVEPPKATTLPTPANGRTKRQSGKRSRIRAFLIATLVLLTGYFVAERFELVKWFKLPSRQLASKELFDRASPAVVRVNVSNSRSEPIGHGSGFLVRDNSTVVTNFHVIDGAHSAEVVLKNGTKLSVKGVVAFDEASDIAVLSVDRGTTSDAGYLGLGPPELPSVGEHVYVIGSPKGYDYTLSDGIVSGHHEREGRSWIQITAPVSHGSSGSPVLSDDGSVLGVATWVDWGGQNLNFASPTRAITPLLGSDSKLRSFAELIADKKRLLAAMERQWIDQNIELHSRVRALDELPKSFHRLPSFWILKGNSYVIGRDERIVAYQNALALDDRNSQSWWLLGNAHASDASFIEFNKQFTTVRL